MAWAHTGMVCAPLGHYTASRRGFPLGDVYLRWHLLVLLGYAAAGKGFAYLGVGPFYVGEITLALGLLAALLTGAALRTPRSPTVYLLVAFLVWCGARAAIDVPVYGMDTFRDAVIWAYGLFGVFVAGFLVSRPGRLPWLVQQYRRFTWFFVVLMPLLWIISNAYREVLPRIPGTAVAILQPKSTDTLVHLAGIASFQLLGLSAASLLSVATIAVGFVVLSTRSRGSMLGFLVAVGVVGLMQPLRRRLWLSAGILLMAVPILLRVDFGTSIEGRELSARQMIANTVSIFRSDSSRGLDGPKEWRIDWWAEVLDYTVFGPYFWQGKGFGVNLARADGFSLGLDVPLRSPHSCHFTLLARAGVPGVLLWLLVQLAWLREMLRRYRASRRARESRWSRLFLFLIAYWLAFLVNASFDVALEGPMAGIWFWTVFGVGLGAARIHERWPAVLASVPPSSPFVPPPPAPSRPGP